MGQCKLEEDVHNSIFIIYTQQQWKPIKNLRTCTSLSISVRYPFAMALIAEDFDLLVSKLTSAHQSQVNALQKKVERLQSQLRQSKFRSSGSRLGSQSFDEDGGGGVGSISSRSFDKSQSGEQLVNEGQPEGSEFPSPTAYTPSSKKSKVLFGKGLGNISTNDGDSDGDMSNGFGCAKLLSNPKFEAAICLMIFANAVVFALESQNTGMAFGYNSFGGDLPGFFWEDGDLFFNVVEIFFGVIFTLEVVLRLYVRRLSFFCGMWNWLDFIIVLVWIVSKVAQDAMPVNSQVLRLARLIRLFRLLRLVRRIQQFDSLYLMSTAIRSSFGILGWTVAWEFPTKNDGMKRHFFRSQKRSHTFDDGCFCYFRNFRRIV